MKTTKFIPLLLTRKEARELLKALHGLGALEADLADVYYRLRVLLPASLKKGLI